MPKSVSDEFWSSLPGGVKFMTIEGEFVFDSLPIYIGIGYPIFFL